MWKLTTENVPTYGRFGLHTQPKNVIKMEFQGVGYNNENQQKSNKSETKYYFAGMGNLIFFTLLLRTGWGFFLLINI